MLIETWRETTLYQEEHNTFHSEFPEKLFLNMQAGRWLSVTQPAPGYRPDNHHELKMASVTVATVDPQIGWRDLFSDLRWMIQTFDFLPSSEVWLTVGVQNHRESNS